MNSRALPILNAIGCLVLTGVIVLQWQRERALDGSLAQLKSELAAAREFSASESKRAADLERDIAMLKESLEATQQSAAQAAAEQLTIWQTAVAGRDAKLRELDAALAATRQRLDAAIARLKEAGAR